MTPEEQIEEIKRVFKLPPEGVEVVDVVRECHAELHRLVSVKRQLETEAARLRRQLEGVKT